MYKSFPIYDMRTGKVTAVEPWLLPKDAFATLSNCHLRKGVLEKRRGYKQFGRIAHLVDDEQIDTGDGGTEYSGTATNTPIEPGSFIPTDGTETFSDNGSGVLTGDQGGSGTINYTTGAWTLSFNSSVGVGVKILADYNYYPGLAAMGLWSHYAGETETLLAMDTKRINKYYSGKFIDITTLKLRFYSGSEQPNVDDIIVGASSSATGKVVAVSLQGGSWTGADAWGTFHISLKTGTFTSDENLDIQGGNSNVATNNEGGDASYNDFTGADKNWFWLENWNNNAYITNGKDQIRKFDGQRVTCLNIDLDVEGGPDNDVGTCWLIFVYHSHLILLRTTERGTAYYQRLRYSRVNSTVFRDDDWVPAPTEDWIVAADFIGGVLYVWFERSIWKIIYTGDPDLPFEWKKVVDTEGCYAPLSLVAFSDEIIGVGPTRFVGCDGRDAYGIDERVPDFMLNFNQLEVDCCYGLVVEEMGQALISYPAVGEDRANHALALNYDDNCFAVYDLPIHCLGYSMLQTDPLLDDIDEILDDIDYSFDDKEMQGGYPTTLMGCRTGYIYKLNYGGTDDGSAIAFEAISGRWNPYIEQGKQARFGWLDIFVDVDQNVSFTVDFYINTASSAYKSVTITCSGTGDKVWKRIWLGTIAQFHRIRIWNNASNQRPRVHAIVPYFQEAGRLL